jgi:predicted  nucleic acid-binding Zn-ribbon protein
LGLRHPRKASNQELLDRHSSNDPPAPDLTIQRQQQQKRRRELNIQMQEIHREMESLHEEVVGRSLSGREGENNNAGGRGIEELVALVRDARARIAYLQMQLHSSWALGAPDEPPPAYDGEIV